METLQLKAAMAVGGLLIDRKATKLVILSSDPRFSRESRHSRDSRGARDFKKAFKKKNNRRFNDDED